MANGYFERGEVYGIRMDSGFGSEQGYFRPGVIVSCDRGNNSCPTVNVAFTTTRLKDMGINVEIMATGTRSWVLCNQLATVDKNRFGACMGKLTSREMQEVDEALEKVLDLGYVDDTALKEKDAEIAVLEAEKSDLKAEIARLKAQIEAKADDTASREVEVAMWQKLYEKALGAVVDMKFDFDVSNRKKSPVVEKPQVEETPEPVEENENTLLNVNTCTFSELRNCGVSSNIALTMMNRRPYKTLDEVKNVPGITNVMWAILSKKIYIEPVKPEPKKEADPGFEKLNINTASAKELQDVAGFSRTIAYRITGYRKKNGPFTCLEDLLKVAQIFPGTLEKRREFLEV